MAERLDKNIMVFDLGCGPGQTAGLLHSLGFEKYCGIDFSKQAIEMAKQAGGCFSGYKFEVDDLFNYIEKIPDGFCSASQQIFCSETLEHIEKDVELLDLLRTKFPGSRIAISVPTFDDPGHVRHFKSTKEAKDRYSPFIKIDDTSQIGPWIIIQGILHIQ
jgi:SAM-dependent methyltransferase